MTGTHTTPGARFIDPIVLSRIGNLELVARHVVEGFINGMHRSPYFGASVDFAEHRGYVAGDDIRRVDWRLYARTDRFYIKEYEADTNANFSVLLDVSKSMGFGSRGVTKLDYAKMLAGCLTYLVHKQRDRVGLVAFDSDIVEFVPSSAKHMDVVLHTLDKLKPAAPGSLRAPLHKMAEHFGRRGLLVLISDLYEEPDAVLEAVGPLRSRGNDLDRVPPARSGGARFLVRCPVELRGSGERGADSGRAGRAGRPVPIPRPRARGRPAGAFHRQPHRLHAREHVGAARSRVVQLPHRARACCDEDCLSQSSEVRRQRGHMSFLTPLFLLGLATLAVPVIIHLIQRERKNVVQFPSLMFLRRIPYQSVRRRRIRNWPLLLLRLAALALIVAAFARPFLRRDTLSAAAAGGAREVVVLIDRSYSMGYGDRWARATAAAGRARSAPSGRPTGRRSCSSRPARRSPCDRPRIAGG